MTIYSNMGNVPFAMISNEMLQDTELSFKAKGILAYLLSKPHGWQVYESDILKQSKDGRDSVRAGIRELVDAGYIVRGKRRGEGGTWAGYEYAVYQHRTVDGFSGDGKSDNGKSDDGKPAASNNDLSNKDLINKDNKKKKDYSPKRQKPTYSEDSRPYRLALKFKQLQDAYLSEIGLSHLTANSNMQTWADDFRKILELDKRPEAELGEIVKWLVQDQFWRKNVLSPDKLREQYEKLAVAMQESRRKPAGATRGMGPKKEVLPIVQNPQDGSQTPTKEEFDEYVRKAEEMVRQKREEEERRKSLVGREEGRR